MIMILNWNRNMLITTMSKVGSNKRTNWWNRCSIVRFCKDSGFFSIDYCIYILFLNIIIISFYEMFSMTFLIVKWSCAKWDKNPAHRESKGECIINNNDNNGRRYLCFTNDLNIMTWTWMIYILISSLSSSTSSVSVYTRVGIQIYIQLRPWALNQLYICILFHMRNTFYLYTICVCVCIWNHQKQQSHMYVMMLLILLISKSSS